MLAWLSICDSQAAAAPPPLSLSQSLLLLEHLIKKGPGSGASNWSRLHCRPLAHWPRQRYCFGRQVGGGQSSSWAWRGSGRRWSGRQSAHAHRSKMQQLCSQDRTTLSHAQLRSLARQQQKVINFPIPIFISTLNVLIEGSSCHLPFDISHECTCLCQYFLVL